LFSWKPSWPVSCLPEPARVKMGIPIEFNPSLALRAFETHGRLEEECLPESLIPRRVHRFLKEGQRNYWLEGEIPLLETKGNQQVSRPLASVVILEATHYKEVNGVWTKGRYKIIEVYNPRDKTIHFEGMNKIK
jgi:hypothetical protein